jgi:hypothetical protein
MVNGGKVLSEVTVKACSLVCNGDWSILWSMCAYLEKVKKGEDSYLRNSPSVVLPIALG